MLLCQRTHKTHLNCHLVAAELPLIQKLIDCMHQRIKTYLEREHSILLSVYVYQVWYGVGRCVKDGSCSSSSLEWKLMDCINGISYKCQTLSNTSQMTLFFFFQEDSALVHMHCACNTVQLLRRSRLPFSWTTPPTAPSWAAAWVWVVSHKDWRNQAATGWIVAMHWYSIWVKKCDFRVSPFCQVV